MAKTCGEDLTTVIIWMRAWREEGRGTAKPEGGDTHSRRIEAHCETIFAAAGMQPGMTPGEPAARAGQCVTGHTT